MATRKKWRIFAIAVAAILILGALLALATPGNVAKIGISITGLVDHKITLTIKDLKSRPNVTVTAELICVSGLSLGIHNWTGVRLRDLLNETGVREGAIKVAFFASDDYSTDLTLQDAMRDDVLVAYFKDGVPMNEKTRLVVPGKWGYKWISDIVTIQLVDYDFKGTWESKGYSDSGGFTVHKK